MTQKLTTKQYWESYYKYNHANKEHIINVCSYYDTIWDEFIGNDNKNKTLIEIGGFPGRYLAYLSSRYNLTPTCLDYNSDKSQIESTFSIMNIRDYHIIQEDFSKFKPKQTYDYVLSNGFIEHFKNFDQILDLHVQYLKPGGKLLVMIPNMKGYIRFYKYLVDYKNLKIHNLRSMSLNVFKVFSSRHSINLKHYGYFGEFPHNVHQKLNIFQKIIYLIHRTIFKKYLNILVVRYPSSFFSSTIIVIFEKD